MLAVHKLSFLDYGPFTFSVDASEGISIQGGSGSGKSLLLRAIADLDQHAGAVNLYDQAQDAVAAPDWRQQIGYLLSDAIFWADTAAEHFNETSSPFLQQAIQTLRLEPLLQQPVIKLSSGEKQRFGLLRLMANQPRALLLDEPTSHLDPDSTLAAESIITDYQRVHQCPLILVSHDKKQCARMTGRHYRMRHKSLQEIPA